jgi:hypothetical protein
MASAGIRTERNRLPVLITLFASIHGRSATIPGLWGPSVVARSFVIFVEAIEGIILGPLAGFASGSMGAALGRIIRPREEGFLLSFAFGMGEPMAALVAGLMFKRRWPFVALAFTSMLALFLIDPLTWGARLPL